MEKKYEINFFIYSFISIIALFVLVLSFVPALFIIQVAWSVFSELSIINLIIKSLALFVALNLFLFVLPLFTVAGRLFLQLLGLKVQPGVYPIKSRRGMYWWAYNVFVMSSLRIPYLLNIPQINKWLLLLMGAKIGSKTTISGMVTDPQFFEIGKNVLTSHVTISGHVQQKGEVILGKVKIGNNCLIGYNTLILPGVVIDDDVVVGARSLVPMGKHLTKGVWAGTPVRKIKD